MAICFQCGSNMPFSTVVCQKCGFKNAAEKPILNPEVPSSPTMPPRVVNKPVAPPPLARNNPGKVSTAQSETNSNRKSNNKKIIFLLVFLLIIIVGIFAFNRMTTVDNQHQGIDPSENIIVPSQIELQDENKIHEALKSQEAVTNEMESNNLKTTDFNVESYLSAVNSKQWDRIETLIGTSNVSLPSQGNRKSARKLNEEALIELRNKNFERAIEVLKRAVAEDQSDLEILNNLGFAQTKTGNLNAAKATYLQTLSYAPTRSITWGNLAEIYANENQADLAYAALQIQVYVAGDRQKVIDSLQKLVTSNNPDVRNSKLSEIIGEHLNDLQLIPVRD